MNYTYNILFLFIYIRNYLCAGYSGCKVDGSFICCELQHDGYTLCCTHTLFTRNSIVQIYSVHHKNDFKSHHYLKKKIIWFDNDWYQLIFHERKHKQEDLSIEEFLREADSYFATILPLGNSAELECSS